MFAALVAGLGISPSKLSATSYEQASKVKLYQSYLPRTGADSAAAYFRWCLVPSACMRLCWLFPDTPARGDYGRAEGQATVLHMHHRLCLLVYYRRRHSLRRVLSYTYAGF